MTREEARDKILELRQYGGLVGINCTEALDMALDALEQEPVLNKIRTEIEEQVLESLSDGGDDWFTAEKVNECLEIIDKYKVESEEV